ncbi:MAG TPA: 30S ribosomal protein S18, partial [Firmicutes bacterium]|nr:30S ribosomal protein S18 [Bacillota bacterium]
MGKNNDRDGSGGKERGMRRPKKKICSFCVDKVQSIDYKETAKVRK